MEYVSQKTVTILERRLGLMHLFFFILIMGYMVGVRLILEKGYLAEELSHGFVTASLEGVTYSKGTVGRYAGHYYRVDAPELVGPQLESDALFVPTTLATTRGQRMDNCTDPAQPCNSDSDCMRLPPLAYGLCEDGRCVQLGWCPRENSQPGGTSETTVLQNLRDLQLVLSGDMHFPRLEPGLLLLTEDGRKGRTSWSLATILRRAGVPYAHAVENGVVLSVVLDWTCDLNPGAAPCIPRLKVYPLAGNTTFDVQWAAYYQVRNGKEQEQHRDLYHAKGLRLLLSSRGTGRRIDLYACVLQLVMILALVPVASMIADTIMQNVFAERRHYREYKNEMTPDFSDVRAKVEQLEQQNQAQQQKMLDYGAE